MAQQHPTVLRRFLQGALADWFRDQARRYGYAPEPRPKRQRLARRIVEAALAEGVQPARQRRSHARRSR